MAKIQIRLGVFETNSSSTHAVFVVSSEEFKQWEAGEVRYCPAFDNLLPTSEALEENRKEWQKEYWVRVQSILKNKGVFSDAFIEDAEEIASKLDYRYGDCQYFYLTFDEFEKVVDDLELRENDRIGAVALSIYTY